MTFCVRIGRTVVEALASLIGLLCVWTVWNYSHRHTQGERMIKRHATGHGQWFYRRPVAVARLRVSTGRPDLSVRVRQYVFQFVHHLWMWVRIKAGAGRQASGRNHQENHGNAVTAAVIHQDLEAQPPRAVIRDQNGILVTINARRTESAAV